MCKLFLKQLFVMLMVCVAGATAYAQTITITTPLGDTTINMIALTNFWGANPNGTCANLVLVDDGSAADSLGCGDLVNGAALAGNIAVAFRGACPFEQKAIKAQNAGAIGLIVINTPTGAVPPALGGVDTLNATIPAVLINNADGLGIASILSQGVTLSACMNIPNVDVLFSVDMSQQTIAPEGAHIAGTFNDWTPTPMTDAGNGIWTFTANVLGYTTHEYKFLRGSGWTLEESVPAACGVDNGLGGYNRIYYGLPTLPIGNDTVPTVCFSKCGTCNATVTLSVDMSQQTVSPNGVHVAGDFQSEAGFPNDWDPAATELTDPDGDGIYSVTITVPADSVVFKYKFINGNEWANEESVPSACGISNGLGGNDRFFTAPADGGEVVLDTVCFNLCGSCNVTVTFQVDMSQQTVSPNGVHIAGSFQSEIGVATDWDPAATAMTDADGNGVYELTVTLPVGFEFQYKFINGDAWGSDEGVPADCGVDNGFGGFNRSYTVVEGDQIINKVCFGACGFCETPFECNALAVICDNFESYAFPGTANSTNSSWWTTWSGAATSAEDAAISQAQSLSGGQSLEVNGAPAGDDAVLNLGNRNGGEWLLEWSMYIPSGKGGYYNLQRNVPIGAGNWIMEASFNPGGQGYTLIDADTTYFTFPHDTWFKMSHLISIDADTAFYFIDTTLITSRAFHYAANGPGSVTNKNLGGVDFYPRSTTDQYFIDNVQLIQLSPANNLCASPMNINSLFGGALNTPVTSGITNNFGASTDTTDPTATCFSDNPDASNMNGNLNNTVWYTFTGDGALYNIATVICSVDSTRFIYDTQLAVFTGTCGNFTQVACNDDVSGTNYMSALDIQTTAGTTYYVMVDGWDNSILTTPSPAAEGEFCVQVTKKSTPPPPLRNVTFIVDMAGEEPISANGVHIAGNFQGWNPSASAMTNNVGTVWTYTVQLPQGDTIQYKYLNGNAWGTDETVPAECGVDNGQGGYNRFYVVGTTASQSIPRICFSECDNVCETATSEAELANGISVFPNPTSHVANVQYQFAEANNLRIRVSNTLGQLIEERIIENALAGTLSLNMKDYAAGQYMIQISNGAHQVTKRLSVLR